MKEKLKKYLGMKEVSAFLVLVIMCLVVGYLSPFFFKSKNIFNILRQVSIYCILAVGEALVIITGGIDLSIGYLFGLCGIMTALLANNGVPAAVIFCIVLLFGACISTFSSLLISKIGISPFIATLGVQNICRGAVHLPHRQPDGRLLQCRRGIPQLRDCLC